ncbi:MAG: C10 family peptidase [Bacteroidales bacterium]
MYLKEHYGLNIRIILIIIFTVILNHLCLAQFINEIDAYNKAVNFFEFKTNDTISIKKNSFDLVPIVENDTNYFYVIDIKNVGWVMISSFEKFGPYLAYSYKNNFSLTDPAPAWKMWIKSYKNIYRYCLNNPEDLSFYQNELVTKLAQKAKSSGAFYLIQTEWHQFPPYNSEVEDDGLGLQNNCIGSKCTAGCVAIAIAQIMRYWNYPYGDYVWCRMNPTGNIGTQSSHAVATLVKDIGLAVEMDYCSNNCASSSNIQNAKSAFKNVFDYSEDIDIKRKFWFSQNKWKKLLREELNKERPLYYRGGSEDGGSGHAFICDGYDFDDNNYFHFNWGWIGSYNGMSNNGFYLLFNSEVDENIYYSNSQKAIFNIKPKESEFTCDGELEVKESYRNSVFASSIYWFPLAGFLSTANAPNNVVINPNEHVEYNAYHEIVLNDFTVKEGADFVAKIRQCPLDCKLGITYLGSNNNSKSGIENNSFNFNHSKLIDSINNQIKIYPNPFTDKVFIEYNDLDNLNIDIFDIYGKKVLSIKHFSKNKINLGYLNAGVFLIKISNKNFVKTQTLIKL